MEKKTGKNKENVIGKILRRPIVRIALLLVIIIMILYLMIIQKKELKHLK